MGLLDRMERRATVTAGASVATGDGWLAELFGGTETLAGIAVTETEALKFSPFAATVFVTSEAIGSLPCKLYRRKQPRGRDEVREDPRFDIVHSVPNPEMTAMTWKAAATAHCLMWGNHYSEIVRNNGGRVAALYPILPTRVRVEREKLPGGKFGAPLYWISSTTGPEAVLRPDQVLHVPGPTLTGILGLNQVDLARESIGLGLAATLFGSAFFGNGSAFGGFLEHPGKLSKEAQKRLTEQNNAEHQGVRKAGKLKVLEEGMKYHTGGGVPPDQAQYMETRRFQVTESARNGRIPPHMIGDLERATFSNIEHQGIQFVIHTLRPWLVRWEQEFNRKLLSAEERKSLYFEHTIEALLRGDTATRYNAHSVGRQWGWLSANDVREMENMDPLPGDQGDKYMVPLNMIPADRLDEEPVAPAEPAAPAAKEEKPADRAAFEASTREVRARFERALLPLFHRELSRVLTKDAGVISRVAEKNTGRDLQLEAYKAFMEQRTTAQTMLTPVVRACVEAVAAECGAALGVDQAALTARVDLFSAEHAAALAERHVGELRARLAPMEDDAAAIRSEAATWPGLAAEIAQREARAASDAALELTWQVFKGGGK